MNIRKRVFVVALAATLIGDSLHFPGYTVQAAAQEINFEESEGTVSGNNIIPEDSVVSEVMHIGQTTDMDELSCSDDMYDTPICLTLSSKVRLFCTWDAAINEEDLYKGTLTWEILRGEIGTQPGTKNIVNVEDDWVDFETVLNSPYFTIQEDEDESSCFYRTLMVTANEVDGEEKYDSYDYYIRATFQYRKDETEYIAITTVPIEVAANEEETENETSGTEEDNVITESENESEAWEADEENIATETENESETWEEDEENIIIETEEESETEEKNVEKPEGITTSEDENTEVNSEEDFTESETVATDISKLMLNKTSITMNPGDTFKPSVTIVPEGLHLNISWSSNNSDVAAVDEVGNIMALAEGRAQITAECGGKTATIVIDVVKTDAEKNHDQPKDEEGNVIAISDEVWIAGFERESEVLTYTGAKITQNLRIYHKGTLLKEKTDYVLTYKNNINAAAYNSSKAPSVTITMKGQYTGSRTLYFTIAPRDIDENHTLGYEQVIQYSKKMKIPAPTIYFGSKKLIANKDFSCDYSSLPENYTKGDSYEAGESYEYTVHGRGNFTGIFTMKLTVIKDKNQDFGKAVITLDKKQYEYHGEALSASDVRIVSVKFGKKILDESLYEYKVYAEDAGNGYVEVYPSEKGRSEGYRGIKKLKIKVVGDRNIKDTQLGNSWQDVITYSKKKTDNNGGICQEKAGVLIFSKGDSSEPLTEGVDYTVKYSNHKKVGKATIIFTGMGRYKGTLKKTYRIVPNTELYVKWHNTDDSGVPVVAFTKGGAIPEFSLMEVSKSENSIVLNSKTDYSVKVKNNKKPGIMTCEITGKGNYKGYKSIAEIKVISGDIGQGTITAGDKQYSNKPNAWKSVVTITDVNGKKLTAGTDYDKKLIYSYDGMKDGLFPQAGTVVYVTAMGINNYSGSSITGSYRIYSKNISKLTVLIDAQEYTGKEIELSADDIHVYADKRDVKKGKELEELCYEIVKYSNNIKAGTAKVTLRGIGAYGGTKTYSFKISRKKYLTTRVTGISLNETSITIGAGNSRQLTATVLPQDACNKTVIWSTSNSKIATVSEEGIITAKKPGTITIKATSQDTGKKASCKVKVSIIPVTSFSLNAEEINQFEGTQYQLTATEVRPADATYSTIQWESTNPEIASVDANGKISLNKAGMAVIKAYADEQRFVRKCLVIVRSKEETEPEGNYLTPQMFRNCNEDDDTESFNDAIQNISAECNTVYVPAGTYKIDAETSILLRSNMNFVMSPNAVLQAIDNSSMGYKVIYANNIRNVTISGGQIKGERYGHGSTGGEWGMGIGIYDSTNINVTDMNISDCWGDGIYIGSNHEKDSDAGCNNITITNCNVYNNRRNNLSIVSADYVTVDSCTFNDANGTAPEYGIDIETNNLKNPCEHITISNSTFHGNAKASIGIVTTANDVKISGCTLNGNFINYDGTNVTISNSIIRGKMYARIGVLLTDGTKINDGGSEEDLLIATFSADKGPYTLGEFGIDASNVMSYSVIDDSDSPSGKALCIKRQSKGTKEAGYYLEFNELTDGAVSVLEKGATYRFEYVVKGSGQWGIKTNQTGWYPSVPRSDRFSTGFTTYTAGSAKSCRLMLYAVDMTEDMYLEIESIKIYKVR